MTIRPFAAEQNSAYVPTRAPASLIAAPGFLFRHPSLRQPGFRPHGTMTRSAPPPLILLLALIWGCGGSGGGSGVPAGVDPARPPTPAAGLGAGTGAAWYYRLPSL